MPVCIKIIILALTYCNSDIAVTDVHKLSILFNRQLQFIIVAVKDTLTSWVHSAFIMPCQDFAPRILLQSLLAKPAHPQRPALQKTLLTHFQHVQQLATCLFSTQLADILYEIYHNYYILWKNLMQYLNMQFKLEVYFVIFTFYRKGVHVLQQLKMQQNLSQLYCII